MPIQLFFYDAWGKYGAHAFTECPSREILENAINTW